MEGKRKMYVLKLLINWQFIKSFYGISENPAAEEFLLINYFLINTYLIISKSSFY